MDIIFITAFKDIKRENWNNIYNRSINDYLKYFNNLVNNIKYKILVYVEDEIYKNLVKLDLKLNIEIINSKNIAYFFDKYIDDYKRIMDSEIYKNKLNPKTLNNPEYIYAEYNLINHSKVNFILDAKNKYPNFKYYSWIDFGCIRDINDIPNNINFNKLNDRLLFQCINKPDVVLSPNEMLKFEYIFIAGSQFVIPNNLVELYHKLYDYKIKECIDQYVCDDDQSIIYQIFIDNPLLFTLYVNPKWFKLFSGYLNIRFS